MGRDPSYVLEDDDSLVEVTNVTEMNRFLLQPSEELNDIFIGVVGRAQRTYGMRIMAVQVLSSHFHMLVAPQDADHLARFMGFVDTNLSKEVKRLQRWPGRLWAGRYHKIPVSPEEEAQISRLKYCLSNGTKEFLVDRPCEWPGVQSATTLVDGEALIGHWYDRTKQYAAVQLRGEENVDPEDFATEERVVLEPLPCWQHLTEEEYRERVADLVVKIEEEAALERQQKGKKSLGVKKILRRNPFRRSRNVEESQKPRFHAVKEEWFKRMREAYAEVIQAYREASARLLSGDRDAEFPEGTFPPGLPFVPFSRSCLV